MQLYSVTYCAKNTDPDTNSESVVMKVYDNIKHHRRKTAYYS